MIESLEARLRRVQEELSRGLPDKTRELLALWDGDLDVSERLKRAHHLAHRLAGGAGTLGQADLSTASKVIELELQALIEGGQPLDEGTCARLRQQIVVLTDTIHPLP